MAKGEVDMHDRIIVIGGSAGSLEVILALLPLLQQPLRAPLVIVLHRRAAIDSTLIDLLATRTSIPAKEAEEKEPITPGTIYIAPGDYHLLFEDDYTFSLDYSEKVNYSRPSIDIAFQSAAAIYGSRLMCILLSGANADGVQGMKAVKEAGGTTIAQDPATAAVSYMPEQAVLAHVADHVLAMDEIAGIINA